MLFAIFVITVLLITIAEHFLPTALLHVLEPCAFLLVLALGPDKTPVALLAVILEFALVVGPVGPDELALAVPVVLLPLALLE